MPVSRRAALIYQLRGQPSPCFNQTGGGAGRIIDGIERATIRIVARRLLPLGFLLYLLSLIDRVNLGSAALTMNKELGLTPYTYSLGVAAFVFGYIPCEIPSNLILERIGARLWIGRIAITWGLIASAKSEPGSRRRWSANARRSKPCAAG
jgi:hypothetical protein